MDIKTGDDLHRTALGPAVFGLADHRPAIAKRTPNQGKELPALTVRRGLMVSARGVARCFRRLRTQLYRGVVPSGPVAPMKRKRRAKPRADSKNAKNRFDER